ncbi:MAG TPA: glycosyl transferase family protein [Bryobacteraceae bacterium]|nr:glycosyl transferase family protein [Bryobacteraceae bacterium]
MLSSLDHAVLSILTPLAVAILLSGLDDLVIDAVWAFSWLRGVFKPAAKLFPPGPRQLDAAPQRAIAILVPLWNEYDVIARMLEHNLASIRYSGYHFFVGAYPNDQLTREAVQSVADRFSNVHLALCPHDGPTSKADCLNWIYQRLILHEEQTGQRFDIVVTHDAEDLIHPEELRWINFCAARFDFIQTPVLALRTPLLSLTHGVYCDEFAEYHTRDMAVRPMMGGFVPSSGVGTGYRRDALEKLARSAANRIFEPEALTEDYENGLRLFRLGCTQTFVPLVHPYGSKDFVATREFFPQKWTAAMRQRTRWVMGIALQTWERHGWCGTPAEVYWLWRDRKGLIANPLSLLANLVFVYGLATGIWRLLTPFSVELCWATFSIQCLRMAVRMGCVGRVYGPLFAFGVPVRAVYANTLNAAATFNAVARYAAAKAQGRPLKWLKTEHAYPNRAVLLAHKRKLGEILVGSGDVGASTMRAALESQPPGVPLGEHLVRRGYLSEDRLYQALSLQQGLPVGRVEPESVPASVARALPEHVVREWRVLPFKVAEGNLFLAGARLPSREMNSALRSFTALEIQFHLVTPTDFENLAAALLYPERA